MSESAFGPKLAAIDEAANDGVQAPLAADDVEAIRRLREAFQDIRRHLARVIVG